MKDQGKSKRKLVLWILVGIAVAGIAAAVAMLASSAARQGAEREALRAIESAAESTPQPPATPAPTAEPPATPAPTPKPWYADYASEPDRQINFDELQAKNAAIYGWIVVPGTKVDYPIAHAIKNDLTYLDRDAFLQKNSNGAIFTEDYNAPDFSDRVTMIYGHNMKSGEMFGNLKFFRDAKFFGEHDTVRIYFEDKLFTYKIFAAYVADARHILAYNDFTDDAVYGGYLKSIFDRRDLTAQLRNVDLTTNDRIITLVTCVGRDDKRLFVQAVLTKHE